MCIFIYYCLQSYRELEACVFKVTFHLRCLIVAQVHKGPDDHTDYESLVESDFFLIFFGFMIFARDSCEEFKSVVNYNKGARIISAQVVHAFGESEFPKLSTEKFHGLKLRLEFHLHISGKEVDALFSQLTSNGV